jgi:FtsH-binding integral membrane protein
MVAAYIVGMINDPYMTLVAVVMTISMVAALSFYALTTKRDFTYYGGFMWALGSIFVIFAIFISLYSFTFKLLFCAIGVMLFAVYLVIDT